MTLNLGVSMAPLPMKYNRTLKEKSSWVGGSPGLVVMGRDSHSKGHGFESQHRKLDGHFSHIFVVKVVMMFV